MTKLKTNIHWLDELLPEGILVPSSTLISGPGGTGKPLVEFAFVAAWLKAGGSLIGIPLQYPSGELVRTAMNKLYNMDLKNYHGKIVYIQFDPSATRCEKIKNDTVKANMVKPMKLFLKIVRMKRVEFSKKEKEVPIPEEMLEEINKIAEATRKTRITEIKNI